MNERMNEENNTLNTRFPPRPSLKIKGDSDHSRFSLYSVQKIHKFVEETTSIESNVYTSYTLITFPSVMPK